MLQLNSSNEAVESFVVRAVEPHAVTRARERFGLTLTIDDLRQIAAKILCGLSVHRSRQGDGREQHLVYYRGIHLPVIFDPPSRRIVTILPLFRNSPVA